MKRKHDFSRLVAAAACVLLMLASGSLAAQEPAAQSPGAQTVTFRFVAGDDMFYTPWGGNADELARLSLLIDEYRTDIADGRMPLRVDGYCASLPTQQENLRTAFVRANRVKSELITQKALKEADFVTANHATAYEGTHKDVVVVTVHIPANEAGQQQPEPAAEHPRQEIPAIEDDEPDIKEEKLPGQEATPATAAEPSPALKPSAPAKPYCLALRTNLLYDALLLPTLGVEWRINPHVGIRLDGSLSLWGGAAGKVQKMWLISPEVRWYLLRDRRFYAGVSGTYGEYNLYGYPLGKLLKDDTGYQGSLWNAGLTVGYQLRLAACLSVDFSLGLGYTRSAYDSFTVTDGVRVHKDRNQSKNLWGPTQAGISLVWTIGGRE